MSRRSLPPPRWRATLTNRSDCDCRWALRGCVGLGDGSHCWRRCCSPGSPAKLVVVTQTYVLTKPLIDRLRQAHRQLTRRGLAYFVAFLIGDGSEDRCDNPQHPRAALLGELRRSIGAAAVWCVDPALFERVWPAFFNELSALPTRERYPKAGAVGGWQWAWTQCDLHAQVGFWAYLIPALERGRFDTEARGWQRGVFFDYLWVLDWDVAWTGDLARILKSFSSDTADFLSFDAPRAEKDEQHYKQQRLRNYLEDGQVRKALVVPARYSRRMLSAVRQLVASGRHAFCETRSPSLCAEQSSWCQHKGMVDLRPEVFSEYHCATAASNTVRPHT